MAGQANAQKDEGKRDVLVTIPVLAPNVSKQIWAEWQLRNESDQDWHGKKYTLFLSMVEPRETTVKVTEFDIDSLAAGEELTLMMNLDFSKYDFENCSDHVVLMFRILDDSNTIMGDAKDDHMILFVKFDKP